MIQKPTIIIVTVTVHNHNYIMKIKCLHGLYDNIIMAVLRIAVALALIYHLVGARYSTSIYQKQLHVVASLNEVYACINYS